MTDLGLRLHLFLPTYALWISYDMSVGQRDYGLTARGDIKSSRLWFFYWRAFVVQRLCHSMNEFASFFIKYSTFSLLSIKKLCIFAPNYNCWRMSKLATITHPQLLGNKGQGCCVARRNSSFFGTFNVDYLVHSNNLLTHTHTHTHI